jgi:dolichyl-diphosphooligosaccharide--protein glycosyltransferase
MRKRAQIKSIPLEEKQQPAVQKPKTAFRMPHVNKKWWTAISLVAIFLLVLFLTSYFNITSGEPFNPDGTGFDKYYLSGPDPYYNMRLVDQTLYGQDAGHYPYYSTKDPLLNYPLGQSGARAPLLNMAAIMFGQFLTPFMNEVDAVGYAMQFIPALFGALLIFPVYYIGTTLFNKKTGLLAALLVAMIPIHLGSGHGSAYSLFDHDSLNLLLMVTTYAFLIKALREKDTVKSILYSLLAGMPLAALSMVWVEAKFLYTIIAVYAIVQMILDIYQNRIELRVPRSISIIMFTGFLVSAPVIAANGSLLSNLPIYLCIGIAAFGALYYLFKLQHMPWTISLPIIFILGIGGVVFLYFTPSLLQSFPFLGGLNSISNILFGSGIYGDKVSMTIAEAGTYGISRSVMSFGPALFWMAWIGFIFIGYYYLKNEHRRDHLFMLLLFIVGIWFLSLAGRFINDLVPVICLFGAWVIVYIVDKINYPAMIKSIRGAGGGFHGIRRGVTFLHICGILIVGLLVVLPNAYLSLDAAVPSTSKENVFGGLPNGAFGSSFGKEMYWVDAFGWFAKQDTAIQNPNDRPAFISWWDYGFYEVAVGGHPTVADNFQDGIPPAANFHTATSEQQAVSIWIIRLLEGNVNKNGGTMQPMVQTVLGQYLNDNDTDDLISWVEAPEQSPSYGDPIAESYNPEMGDEYPVGQQWPINAVYHDGVDLLVNALDDENLTMLYRDIQETTGTSILYYGVEGYDKQIFNIFGFLGDNSLLLVAGAGANPEDDFVQIQYVTQNNKELTFEQVQVRTDSENRLDPIVNTKTVYKPAYFDTMFYRTYVGLTNNQSGTLSEPDYQIPCYDMRHFYAQYISPYPQYAYYQGKSAVVIAKYYAGAIINGTLKFQDELKNYQIVVQQNISHYGSDIPVDHDSITAINGTYQVLVPAGVSTLQVRRYPELGANAFAIQNVTFNDTDLMSNLAPITEDEAARKGPYQRTVDISIQSGDVKGYVYKNNDNNTVYNESVDTPLKDITISFYGIDAIDPSTGQPQAYDFTMLKTDVTDENGYYNLSGLLPGYYQVLATTPDDYQIDNTLLPINGGENTYDIAKPEPGDAQGTIYFDDNSNGKYDGGEEMNGVKVDLVYTTMGDNKLVDSFTTDTTGGYSFTNLIPGVYMLNVTKLPDYETTQDIIVREKQVNTTNVSLQYAQIQVTGTTKNKDSMSPVSNISMTFNPDTSIENNTAKQITAKSSATGAFTASLMPGTYNITISQKVNESGVNVTYSFTGQFVLNIGQGTKTYDMLLARIEE